MRAGKFEQNNFDSSVYILCIMYSVCNTIDNNNNNKSTTEHWTVEQQPNGFYLDFFRLEIRSNRYWLFGWSAVPKQQTVYISSSYVHRLYEYGFVQSLSV